MKKSSANKSSSARTGKATATPRRTWIVLGTLFGMLTFTGALLKALDPGPLNPDAASSLFAINGEQTIDRVFDTNSPLRGGRWKYIFIHQSLCDSGNAMSLGEAAGGLPDHFVIGNGAGAVDGEIQIGRRWSQQLSAGIVPGTEGIKSDCISICLVGDLNHKRPTPTQQARLAQLVTALRRQLGISGDRVILLTGTKTAAGAGTRFPAADFLAQLNS